MDETQQDKWDIALDAKIKQLKECQVQNNIDSCLKCDKVLNCEVREKYVVSVYESMNKGSGGGFEF
ncbi:MAG: hypothetical protein U9Q33_04635 [Campylobacterota bacterium]|nr:hypothetical protein [Campylobacterota bacterium]